ncbi:hypothetical protein ACHAWF_005236 [Thalassiosira exigua]
MANRWHQSSELQDKMVPISPNCSSPRETKSMGSYGGSVPSTPVAPITSITTVMRRASSLWYGDLCDATNLISIISSVKPDEI